MDSKESFLRAWNERFPQESSPDLEVFIDSIEGSPKNNGDPGKELSVTDVEKLICQKEIRVKLLKEELEKEQFMLGYLEDVLNERRSKRNGEKDGHLNVPDDGSGSLRTKLIRGRPLVSNVEHWRSKSIDSERSDDDDRSKSPEAKRKLREKAPKPKHVASSSFANRSYNIVNIPARSASLNTPKSSKEANPHAPVKQTASENPAVPPKPRRTKHMQQLIETIEGSVEQSTEAPSIPAKPRSRSHSREKLDELKTSSPRTSPRMSPKSSPSSTRSRHLPKNAGRDESPHVASENERRGSQGLDDIPRARDLPSSLTRGSRGPNSSYKKGSREDLDSKFREGSPKPLSERHGSCENLLDSKSGIPGKPRADSEGTYQELDKIVDRKSGLKGSDSNRPSSFTNRAYVGVDIDENRRTLEKLNKKDSSKFKVPVKPWEKRHNYEEIEFFPAENNTPGINLQSTSSHGSGAYEDIDDFLGKGPSGNPALPDEEGGTSVSKDEYYDNAELSSLSSENEDDIYDNALEVNNDLMDSSSDDDDQIYYNLVHMKPPLIPMLSDADEIKECIYADPREIIERKRETQKKRENAVRFRISNSGTDRMKRTLHQRLSIEATSLSPDNKSLSESNRYSIGSDSVFLGTPNADGSNEGRVHHVSGRSYLDVEKPNWEHRSLMRSRDKVDEAGFSPEKSAADEEQLQMRKWVITSIIESENLYLDCLNILIQYMKSLQLAENTSQHVLQIEDIKAIFFRLPEIHDIHKAFFEQLQPRVEKWSGESQVADLFKELVVQQFSVYKEYLLNYKKAVATVQRCSQENEQFHELAKSIKGKGIQGSESLEQLLHKPVLRIQRNCLVLQDLVQWTPIHHPDFKVLEGALKVSYHNLENLIDPTNSDEDESTSRQLMKNSLIVEQVQGNRKLRHVFLFDDVIVCTKPKMGNRTKCAFEVKWFIPVPCIRLDDLVLAEGDKSPALLSGRSTSLRSRSHSVKSVGGSGSDDSPFEQEFEKKRKQEVDALKKRVSVLKDDLKKELQKEDISKDKAFFGGLSGKSVDKIKKKLVEQQAALVLASPKLVFRIHNKESKVYTLLMSSDYEREEWRESIRTAQAKDPKVPNLSIFDVQSLVNSCRQIPRVNVLGTMLMRQGQDEEIMHGVLNVTVHKMMGMLSAADTFCCLEVDSYGNFSMQAKTNLICNSLEPKWNETFEITLDGSQTLRVLCYRQMPDSDHLLGKCALELNQNWLKKEFQEMTLSMGELSMVLSVQYVSREQTMKRVQSCVKTGVFGVKLESVLMREMTQLPMIVTSCVAEVEKRGMDELGIYRVSGVSSEIQRLKKLFEKSSKAGVEQISHSDIHAVTGLLKLYFRELPEALFTDQLYRRFVDGLGLIDPVAKERCMLALFKSLPETNHRCILFILDHLLLVSRNEVKNKMSVKNLATIFGPTLLRPAFNEVAACPEDLLSMGTRDVFDQSGILFYFLELRREGHDFARFREILL